MNTKLCEPILDRGIRHTNFFNGRLLTAEDLEAEKLAQRESLAQLGRAIGGGVVTGLEVSIKDNGAGGKDAILSVDKGLALTSMGQRLYLPDKIEIVFARQPEAGLVQGGKFAPCEEETTSLAKGIGIYILMISAASGFDQYAPMTGLGAEGKITGCGSRYAVDGVQFRRVKFDPGVLGISDDTVKDLTPLLEQTNVTGDLNPTQTASLSMLRNRLAHLFFGTETLANVAADPFALTTDKPPQSLYARYGALDALIAAGVRAEDKQSYPTQDDVPLALLYWTIGGLRFADMGSVRRRPAAPFNGDPWSALIGERRLREGEAVLGQFAEHLEGLRDMLGNLESVAAKDYFRYLPAAGIMPISTRYLEEYMKEAGKSSFTVPTPTKAFYPPAFFHQLTVRKPAFIEGAKIGPLLRASTAYPPIDLNSKELVWLYLVRENGTTVAKERFTPPPLYMIFTNGHMAYQGNARYDLNRWDYSNYAVR